MQLEGKIALVTGGSRRIGREISAQLARVGCDIIVHYNTSEADAIELVEQIKCEGQNALAIRADLRDPQQIEDMFALVAKTFTRLDVLVNNASVYYRTDLNELTPQQLNDMLAVNTTAPALCIKHAAGLMKNSGAIINIADAKLDRANYPAYCTSKAALIGLTKSTAVALAPRSITVNAVCPGVILWDENTPEDLRNEILAQVPTKRAGTPQDIAHAVVFLASQNYITGQTLNVDGGWNM